jgi:hypothetical protein
MPFEQMVIKRVNLFFRGLIFGGMDSQVFRPMTTANLVLPSPVVILNHNAGEKCPPLLNVCT